jgi:hypothetical protein
LDQLRVAALRGGAPVAFEPYPVLGETITRTIGEWANLPAYWLIFLVVEFPATYLAGLVALIFFLRHKSLRPEVRSGSMAFAFLLGVSLSVAWLMVSTLGENNDLGWRAVLPAVIMLIALTAAGLARLTRVPLRIAAFVLLLAGVPDAAMLVYGNAVAAPNASAAAFARTPALWDAVRRHTSPTERIGNNPLHMQFMTPWSVNISWAQLADRR